MNEGKSRKYSILDCIDFFIEILFYFGVLVVLVWGVFYFSANSANAVMRRGTHSLPITMPTSGSPTGGGGGGGGDAILLEDGVSYLLLEDGSKILLE